MKKPIKKPTPSPLTIRPSEEFAELLEMARALNPGVEGFANLMKTVLREYVALKAGKVARLEKS